MKSLKWKDVIFLAVDTAEKNNLVEKDLELLFADSEAVRQILIQR